jgi:nucleoporin NDC1
MSTPDRLNERPIYLRSVFLLLALCQTAIHIYKDYSSVHLPVSAPTKTPTSDDRTHKLQPITMRIQNTMPSVLQRCAITCGVIATTGPFIYALFLRQTFWSWHLTFAKLIYSLPRSDARPAGYPPSNPQFMLRSLGVGFLLMLTWETTSLCFSTFLSQEPLKKEQPLSAGSRDQNGTLITGLKAKRDVVKTFAFWELAVIAQKHADRRRAIFTDIGREGGHTWGQMLDAALDVVQEINTRIEAASSKFNPAEEPQQPDVMDIDSLPRIAPAIKERPIFADSPPPQTRTEEIESFLDWGAKRIGQSKRPFNPPISRGKELFKFVIPAGMSVEDLSPGALPWYCWSILQDSSLAWFFRVTFERRVNTIILGSPQGNAAVIVDAIEATTRMLVASLSEDIYGKVIGGVPRAVRTFTSTITAIEAFVQNVKEEAAEDSDIEEVEIILARLKASLAELLSAFQLYLTDVGLSAVEHRRAQDASRPGRLLPEPPRRSNDKEGPEKERHRQLPAEQNDDGGDVRKKDVGRGDGAGKGRSGKAEEQERGRGNGARGSQKRLEPQDPARKKLFQNTVPKSIGRREMEMVR